MAIKVCRKINTSAVLALDDDGRELVALGRGIGFTDVGAPLDIARVNKTFYNVDERYVTLLNEISYEVFEFSIQLVQVARGVLSYELSPNIAFTLADHIAFALKRAREHIEVKMPLAYDVAQHYPLECKIGRWAVKRLAAEFGVSLPADEAVGIAMAFINNIAEPAASAAQADAARSERVLDRSTRIVEKLMGVKIDRNSFNYSRFATHVQYLCNRAAAGNAIESENAGAYETLAREYPLVAACVDAIGSEFEAVFTTTLTNEERLYLLLHVNRLCSQERTKN